MNFQPLLTENQTPHWRVDKDVCVLVQFLFFYHQILHFSLIHLCASFFPHSQLLGHKKGAFLNKSAQYILSFFYWHCTGFPPISTARGYHPTVQSFISCIRSFNYTFAIGTLKKFVLLSQVSCEVPALWFTGNGLYSLSGSAVYLSLLWVVSALQEYKEILKPILFTGWQEM